jgi:hypothetical protein
MSVEWKESVKSNGSVLIAIGEEDTFNSSDKSGSYVYTLQSHHFYKKLSLIFFVKNFENNLLFLKNLLFKCLLQTCY